MGGMLGEILARIAAAFLREYLARQDLKDSVRQQLALEMRDAAIKALEWKAAAATSPTGGADLRVSESGGRIELPGPPAGTPGPPG